MKLYVPDELNRNAPHVRAAGAEVTGRLLFDHITRCLGLASLADIDVLDLGCGVRLTQTIVNCELPVKSYTGVDVDRNVVDFLNRDVASIDSRFRFYHWDAGNAMYNPTGTPLDRFISAQPSGHFDLIILYSVLTHMTPEDAGWMLKLARERLCRSGKLFFSAFVDDGRPDWRDDDPSNHLLKSVFGAELMKTLIADAGCRIDLYDDVEVDESFVVRHYLCSDKLRTEPSLVLRTSSE